MALTTVDLPWATCPMVPIIGWSVGVGLVFLGNGTERERGGSERNRRF